MQGNHKFATLVYYGV